MRGAEAITTNVELGRGENGRETGRGLKRVVGGSWQRSSRQMLEGEGGGGERTGEKVITTEKGEGRNL